MSFSRENNVLTFGDFKRLTDNAYNAIEFAWPVRAFECYANKLQKNSLDALALTVLELLNLRFLNNKTIAEDLGISENLLGLVINRELLSRSLCKEDGFHVFSVTEDGKKYLSDLNGSEVSKEKVFGYMFQSMTDGEFLPFFYEGTLPEYQNSDDELYYIVSERYKDFEKLSDTDLQSRINRAYHRYGHIFHKTQAVDNTSLFDTSIFVDADDDIADLDFDFADKDDKEKNTVNESESQQILKDLKNARIKLLNIKPKELNIKFRLYSLKDEPGSFFVSSPFEDNETKWYSESFTRMINDSSINFGMDANSMELLSDYCNNVTQQMYAEIPELKEMNPEEYILRTYPEISHSSLQKQLKKSYMKIVRQQIIAKKGYDNEADIIMNVYRTLELILNNYIKKVDSYKVVGTYFKFIESGDIDSILEEFKIGEDISAFSIEKKAESRNTIRKESLMNHFRNGWAGNSLREKYYFLTFAAYIDKSPEFKMALKEDSSILSKIDSINSFRNEYAGHNDGTDVKDISKKDLENILNMFKILSNVLITNFD